MKTSYKGHTVIQDPTTLHIFIIDKRDRIVFHIPDNEAEIDRLFTKKELRDIAHIYLIAMKNHQTPYLDNDDSLLEFTKPR